MLPVTIAPVRGLGREGAGVAEVPSPGSAEPQFEHLSEVSALGVPQAGHGRVFPEGAW